MNARSELEEWQSLVNHPKWKELKDIAEQQKAIRVAAVLGGLDNIREEDKQRGECMGISLVLDSPYIIIEGLQVEVDNLNKE